MLTELSRTTEADFSPERPVNCVLVELPSVEVGTTRIRLSMHTDNINGLFRVLGNLPPDQLDKLRIQGRTITDSQMQELAKHPVYRFFLSGRLTRSNIGDQDLLAYLMPDNLGIPNEQVIKLIQGRFSPDTLSEEIGFKTVWYDARSLVSKRIEGANFFLPYLGAINEFEIGSDQLSNVELSEIARQIHSQLTNEQYNVLNRRSTTVTTPGFQSINLSNPFPENEILVFSKFINEIKPNKEKSENFFKENYKKITPELSKFPKKELNKNPWIFIDKK